VADKPLDVYLNDHLAGSLFGSDLAKQIAKRLCETPSGEAMTSVAEQIEADRETLAGLMDRLGTSRNPVKEATTWVAEKASRVKLSGLSHGDDELGLLLALETLSLGIEGKRLLWESLAEVKVRYPPLSTVDFDSLQERAVRQRDEILRERIAAASRAFTGDAPLGQ
jgi:hypothetical protein